MLLIEFQTNLHDGLHILKYRNIDDKDWRYLHIDMETLHLLVSNYGIVSTCRMPTGYTNCDNPTTSKQMNLTYCGAAIQFFCGNTSAFDVQCIEQYD